MAEFVYSDSAENVTVYLSIPEGKLIAGRVKEISNTPAHPEVVHPGTAHEWHEMLHFGQPGTGFAECRCGAVGIPYERP